MPHQKGIIHRDLKPNNVLIALYDSKPVPKVIDFGVAKATGGKLTENTLFTGFGNIVGTLEYMSPEQAELNNLDIDTRTDIYSLGVILYELLTGERPLDSKRLRQAAFTEMLRIIREEEAPRPSTRLSSLGNLAIVFAGNRGLEVKRLVQLLTGDLDWVVMTALEKNRNRRYSTPGNFAEDIERYLRREEILARPPSIAYKLKKFIQRNRASVLTATVVALSLIVGMVVATWQAMRATRAEAIALVAEAEAKAERDRAIKAEVESKDQREKAIGAEKQAVSEKQRADQELRSAITINSFLREILETSAFVKPESTEAPKFRAILDCAAKKITGNFDKEPMLEASIRSTIGQTYVILNDYAAAEPQMERAFTLARLLLTEDSPSLHFYTRELASVYMHKGDYSKAEPLLQNLVVIARGKYPNTYSPLTRQPEKAEILGELGQALLNQKKYADAEPLLLECNEGYKQITTLNPANHPAVVAIQPRLKASEERLVELYAAMGKQGEAAKWRKELAARKATAREQKPK